MLSSRLFPEGIANLDLDAGIDAGVAIAERGRRDVNGVYPHVDRPLGAGEVVNANAALRREVPHTGSAVDPRYAVDRGRAQHIRRELMGGVDEASRGLEPGLNAAGAFKKIPAEDDRGKADAAKSAAAHRQQAGVGLLSCRVDTGITCVVRWWCIGLPEGHDVAAVLELAGEDAGMYDGAERFGQLETTPEKFEVRAVAHSGAPIDEWAVLPTPGLANPCDRILVIIRVVDCRYRFIRRRLAIC